MSLPQIMMLLSLLLGTILSLCYAYQILYLFVPFFKKRPPVTTEKLHRYAILIAARNEEAVLPHLLQSIRQQDYPPELFTTFVVADNCTDRTAQVAAQNGAVVFSRFDREKVGKGYALNYLLSQIDAAEGWEQFDAFLVFDADNLLERDYLRQINKVCAQGYDAFCGYRNSKNFGDNWVSAGHSLWYLHESTHLNRSRMLLGNPCMVSGTGFGFTRQLLRRMGGWHFFTLTEDIEFSTWCATRGVSIGYSHQAVLYDEQPQTLRQSWRQRTRWTQGGVQVSLRQGKALFLGMLRGGRLGYACLEAATLLLWGYGMGAICTCITLLTALLSAGWLGLWYSLTAALVGTYCTGLAIGAITLASEWHRIRTTPAQKLMGLFAFPLYILTGIPISVTALVRKYHWPPITHSVAISNVQL